MRERKVEKLIVEKRGRKREKEKEKRERKRERKKVGVAPIYRLYIDYI